MNISNIGKTIEDVLGKTNLNQFTDSLERFLNRQPIMPYKQAKRVFVSKFLKKLLVFSHGNVSRAAKIAGMHRRHLHRLCREFDINPKDFRKEMLKPNYYLIQDMKGIIDTNIKQFYGKNASEEVYDELFNNSDKIVEKTDLEIASFDQSFKEFEQLYFSELIESTKDINQSSQLSGLATKTIQRKMVQYAIA